MKAMSSRDRSGEPNGGGNVDTLRYEVWEDDNSGGQVAVFRYIDDARVFAGPISGLVYDIYEEADVTQYPLDPARGRQARSATGEVTTWTSARS